MSNHDVVHLLETRKKDLTVALKEARTFTKHPVKDHLEVARCNGSYQYYRIPARDKGDKKEKIYLPKLNIEVAREIAEYNYARQVEKFAEEEIKLITKLLDYRKKKGANDCYQKLCDGRKALVKPILLSDEEYADAWLKQRSENKNGFENDTELYTEQNEHVRSKSEILIADKLFRRNIPYKYEEELVLEGKSFFPDFTILQQDTRRVYYWEHLGMMDDAGYADKVFDKLETYSRNGIVQGINLILTFEGGGNSLSTKMVERIIEENFM